MNGVFADFPQILDEFVDGIVDDGFGLGLDVSSDGTSFFQQSFCFILQSDFGLEPRDGARNVVDLRDYFVVDVLL